MSNTTPRFHCPAALGEGDELTLPPGTARHVQVMRLQPGDTLTLFNGQGGESEAVVTHMGRSDVAVRIGKHQALERELGVQVHLWAGIMANERMDWLVEKAAELGACSLIPIKAQRSVLKLKGERAEKKIAHWQAVANAASEQCGRNRVLQVWPAQNLEVVLQKGPSQDGELQEQQRVAAGQRWVLSLSAGAQSLHTAMAALLACATPCVQLLSGPEGGLSAAEEAAAVACGFLPVNLGPRVLRAETAPLAALAALAGAWPHIHFSV